MTLKIYGLLLTFFLLIGPGATPVARSAVIAEEVSAWQAVEVPVDAAFSLDGRRVFMLTGKGEVLVYTVDGRLEERFGVFKGFDRLSVSPRGDLLHLINSQEKMVRTLKLDFVVAIDTSEAPFMGPAEALVVIVVFSDFECSHCGKLGVLFERILEKYPDRVKVAFKNFPLAFHKFARPAAQAALAAQQQGRFWEFHDRLFAQEVGGLDSRKIVEIAADLGLDPDRFVRDQDGSETARRLEQDILDGRKAGVTGTPTIFVNGRRLKGRTMAEFDRVINEELLRVGDVSQGKTAN